jgi:hypothetical protein
MSKIVIEITNSINAFDEAFEAIGKWITELTNFPGFKEWKSKQLGATLRYGEALVNDFDEHSKIFEFPPHIVKQHDAIAAFFALYTSWQAIADTEFYFRRYPFHDLPLSMDTHLRYTCESYFSRIYEFSERMKKCLNALNEVIFEKIEVGRIIKIFAKDFKIELKERNLIHHHAHFNEIMIDKISLMGLMAIRDKRGKSTGWKAEHRRAYRLASQEWAARVKKRSVRVNIYLNAVTVIVIQRCEFLSKPIRKFEEN